MLLMNCPYFERQKYSLILTVSGFIDGLRPSCFAKEGVFIT